MENYRIIPYLEKNGLGCFESGSDIIVCAKGSKVGNISIILSGVQNFLGGCNFLATFVAISNIEISAKDIVLSELEQKYDLSGVDISFNSAQKALLKFTTNMMAIDNKKPEVYCYDFMLKEFIQKIDDSSEVWNK